MSLVGDAEYCPGVAVVAVPDPGHSRRLRASRELAVADGDHLRGFRTYEQEIGDYARRSRAFAPASPNDDSFRTDARNFWAMAKGVRLVPTSLQEPRALANLNHRASACTTP